MLGWFSPYIFLGARQRGLMSRGLPIFAWHKVAVPPRGSTDPFLFAAPAVLDRQLGALRAAGFRSLSLSEVAGRAAPDARVVLTFDDGTSDVLANGLPLLLKHGFQAIQFLVAGHLGGCNEWDVAKGDVAVPLMDELQVRTWLAAGMEIGSHSLRHRNLNRLDTASAREEIFASKRLLEDRFGVPIRHFCAPYGAWNDRNRDLVGEAGYETACTLRFGVNTPATPLLELRRIYPLSSAEMVAKVVHRIGRRFGRARR